MRKQIAVFIAIMAIPGSLSVQTSFLDNYTVDRPIRTFEASHKSDFGLIINTRQTINLYQKDRGKVKTIEPDGEAAFPIDVMTRKEVNFWLTGTKFNGKLILLNESEIILTRRVGRAVDYASFTSTGNLFASVGPGKSQLINSRGEKIWQKLYGKGLERLPDDLKIPDSNYTEKFISTRQGKLIFRNRTGEIWSIKKKGYIRATALNRQKVLVWWENGLSLRFIRNGSAIWEKKIDSERYRPLIVADKILYGTGSKLIQRDIELGEKQHETSLDINPRTLKKFPGELWLVGVQGKNISFFSLEGERLGSFPTSGADGGYQFTEYDGDGRKEIAYGSGDTVHVVDVSSGGDFSINQSLGETVFVGNGRAMLQAVALNSTAFVSRRYEEVVQEVNDTGLEPVGVGKVSGIRSVRNVNHRFNVTEPRYYPGTREKAVYVAAFAAKNNASLTFEREKADRDFSSFTPGELQRRFIREFKPNHVVVADLDSYSGQLAAYMAVKQGVLPVDFDQEFGYPAGSELEGDDFGVQEWNGDNGVIKLDGRLDQVFDRIGLNRNIVFSGRQVSILSGPRKLYRDPVEQGILGDSVDGRYFYSDLDYGDIDGDGRLEAGVGRYPSRIGEASELYHRSLSRGKGKKAVVASEYLHENWPVILASLGGGMWHGKNTGYTLQNQGYEVRRFVEYRSQPVKFLLGLLGAPKPEDRFFKEFKSHQELISRYLGEMSVKMVKNAVFVFKSFERAQRTLQFYLEFDWIGWQPLEQELDFPDSASIEELRELLFSALPDRYGHLTQENLEKELGRADIIFYQGVGNSGRWTLPDENGYTGKKNLSSEEVPGLESPVVWDSSVEAGRRDAELRQSFIERGAAAYLGLSTNTYSSYTAVLARRFFKRGDAVGRSLKKTVNHLRSNVLVYDPNSLIRTGVRRKMERAVSLYGNPETLKDPVEGRELNTTRRCEQNICTIKIRVEPDPEIIERGDKRVAVFNATSYLIRDLAPVTPLYSHTQELPGGADILETDVRYRYQGAGELSPQRNVLLSHSTGFYNRSLNYTRFPSRVSRLNVTGDRLEYVQAATQLREGEDRILKQAVATVRYRTPVALELGKQDENLTADIYSESDTEAKLAYRVDGRERVKKVELDRGNNHVELERLEPGIHQVDGYVYRHRLLSLDEATIKVARDLEVFLFAPDMHLGAVRRARVVARNPNGFSVNRDLALSLPGKIQLGLLEDRARKIELGPGETRQLSWRVTGIETGKANISLGGETTEVDISEETDLYQRISPDILTANIGSPRTEFRTRRSSGHLEISLETPRGRATFSKNATHETATLETDSYTARRVETRNLKLREVRTDSGSYIQLTRNGVTRQEKNGRIQVRPERIVEDLESEVKKLEQRYQAREERRLKTNRKME